MREIDALRADTYKKVADVVARESKLKGVAGSTPETDMAILKSQTQLKNLKSELNQFGQKFETVFSTNMAQGFVAFSTGAATAKEAFQGFATGVLKNIAEIIAQEASSQIVKALFGAASGAIGGLFSSGVSVGAGNSAAFSDTMNGTGLWKSANGNLFSGGNIIPFARGGIPDTGSNLQYFPMANGGLGSLRENGPEFIMPAKRDAYGQLGVKADLSGVGGNSTTNVVNITVTNDGKQSADQLGNKLAEAFISTVSRKEIARQKMPGGLLANGSY
jgi:phage-related minor tail protein